MWSNVAESFNSWIRKERLLPIFQLVESIRVKLMEMNAERHIAAEKWNSYLCPEMENQLDKLMEVGRHWYISRSSEFVFEVRSDDSVMVDLEKWYCSCCQWQIKGFPCSHAIAAIMHNDGNPYDYIEDYFTVDYYKSSYSFPIKPIPNIHQPPLDIVKDFVIKPPVARKQPGRPRVKRIKSNGEESRPMKCGRCKKLGHHNKNTCSAPFLLSIISIIFFVLICSAPFDFAQYYVFGNKSLYFFYLTIINASLSCSMLYMLSYHTFFKDNSSSKYSRYLKKLIY